MKAVGDLELQSSLADKSVDDESSEDSDMDGFIYDEDDVEENDADFYRQFDQEIILSDDDDGEIYFNNDDDDDEIDEIIMTLEEPEPAQEEELSPNQERLLNIKLKKVEKCKRKLLNYIEEHPVI